MKTRRVCFFVSGLTRWQHDRKTIKDVELCDTSSRNIAKCEQSARWAQYCARPIKSHIIHVDHLQRCPSLSIPCMAGGMRTSLPNSSYQQCVKNVSPVLTSKITDNILPRWTPSYMLINILLAYIICIYIHCMDTPPPPQTSGLYLMGVFYISWGWIEFGECMADSNNRL